MRNKHALIVGLEVYHNSTEFRNVLYARNDALEMKETLVRLGYRDSNIELLIDGHATKTTITEKIRHMSRFSRKGEDLLFYYAGHGLNSNGQNYLSCVDSSLLSVDETCISLKQILGTLDSSEASRIMLFLDCCHSGLIFDDDLRSLQSEFSSDHLKYMDCTQEYLVGFASCKGDEVSIPYPEKKHGVWTHYLIEALVGNGGDIYQEGLLFSDKLQSFLKEKTSLTVPNITPKKNTQTPIKFGKETDKFIVADVSSILKEKLVKQQSEKFELKEVVFVTREDGPVKNLPGFLKRHKKPDEHSEWHNNWIKKIAHEKLEEEITRVDNNIKETLNYRRKDIISVNVEEGCGEITTKDFDYRVEIEQSDSSPDRYIITRSIENFSDINIFKNKEFNDLFAAFFDELHLKTSAIDVASIIDKVEEINNKEIISVKYDSGNYSRCTIKIPHINMSLEISGHSIIVLSRQKQSPQQLIDGYLECNKQLPGSSIQKLLN